MYQRREPTPFHMPQKYLSASPLEYRRSTLQNDPSHQKGISFYKPRFDPLPEYTRIPLSAQEFFSKENIEFIRERISREGRLPLPPVKDVYNWMRRIYSMHVGTYLNEKWSKSEHYKMNDLVCNEMIRRAKAKLLLLKSFEERGTRLPIYSNPISASERPRKIHTLIHPYYDHI